jgi:arylsulfatase A-like enzyme
MRLVPIAWVHIALAAVAAVALSVHGVRLFHDYERPEIPNAAFGSPDIYLITIDTLRADDTSVYGYGRGTTPNLEKFAQRSFTFDYYFANSNFTTASTSSIETGKRPWSHRVYHPGGFLRDQNQRETLAALLKQQGYYTAMISSNLWAAPFRHRTQESYDAVQYAFPKGLTGSRFRLSNIVGVNTQATLALSLFRAGVVIGQYLDVAFSGDQYPSPAEDVFERATGLLGRHHTSQPVFLWTHILPPHDPYWVPTPFRHRLVTEPVRNYEKFVVPDPERVNAGVSVQELHNAYDEMIVYADHAVGEFLDWLDRTHRLDRSIVIITSDHGELFDHDRLYHGGRDLYQGLIHVPLLIHLPGQKRGVRVDQLSQQIDLLPTVLDLIGGSVPSWAEGSSLRPALEEPRQDKRFIFSMALSPDRTFDPISKGTIAVIDNDFKFVRYLESGREQLYRYKTDRTEENNLVQAEPAVAQRMRGVLLLRLNEVNQRFSQR